MSSSVFVYGSSECDQLGKFLILYKRIGLELGEDDLHEVKRPKRLSIFDMSIAGVELKVPVCKLVCGGMHTVAITPSGAVYTWGCNDEGALGRPGTEDRPLFVSSLPIRCTDASAGDSHTVFYNTDLSRAFFTGLYRVRVANFHLTLERTIWQNLRSN